MRTVFLDFANLFPADLDLSALQAALPDLTLHDATPPEAVAERVRGAEAVIASKAPITEEILAREPQLKLILVAATGTNNVDLEAAARRGVVVCNCQGYGTASVAQHTMALMLSLAVRLPAYHAAALSGAWGRSPHFCLLDYPIMELAGKRLGIVGYGELGQAVGRLAAAFGMQVLVAARPGTPAAGDRLPLEDILPQADVLTLHCPLTEATRGLIGVKALRAMPRHSLLINTARGGIVDEAALRQALLEGWIAGAGLDVLSEEPPRRGNILLDPGLPNLIITPHSAWGSHGARQRLMDQLAENAQAFMAGTPRRRVA